MSGQQNLNLYWELKLKPCSDCNQSFHPYVMDWDHRPGTDKKGNVSEMLQGSREALLEEIEKCDLLCSNCHRTRTIIRLRGIDDYDLWT